MSSRPATRAAVVTAVLALSLATVVASPARAERKVFLNDVDLSNVDVRGHHFERAEVRFDQKGNVYITVKGLKVEKKPAARAPDAAGISARPVTPGPAPRPIPVPARPPVAPRADTGPGGAGHGGGPGWFAAALYPWLQGH